MADNERIADSLIRLTHNLRDWGFGLCFLYLRNVKGYGWHHKRVYRIYRELGLNLQIKPKKRLRISLPMAAASGCSMCWMTTIAEAWAWRSTYRYSMPRWSDVWNKSSNDAADLT